MRFALELSYSSKKTDFWINLNQKGIRKFKLRFDSMSEEKALKPIETSQSAKEMLRSTITIMARSSTNTTHSRGSSDLRLRKDFVINSPKSNISERIQSQNSTQTQENNKKWPAQIVAFDRAMQKNKLSPTELPRKLTPQQKINQSQRFTNLLSKVIDDSPSPILAVELDQKQSDESFGQRCHHSKHFRKRFLQELPSNSQPEDENTTIDPVISPTNSQLRSLENQSIVLNQTVPDKALGQSSTDTLPHGKSSKERYRYVSMDSKFDEILELKREITELKRENQLLKEELATVDEFKVALAKKVKLDNFNEKRIDLLKAQISRQKRYIDHLNKANKISKKLFKDVLGVLKYLAEVEEKYMKSGKITMEQVKQQANANTVTALANNAALGSALEYIKKQGEGSEHMQRFIENFNDAYDKIKKVQEHDKEISKMFTVTIKALKQENMLENRINPNTRKKIRYNYLMTSFIQKYKKIFPIFTEFDNYEFHADKQSFSQFLRGLESTAEKVQSLFNKVSQFDTTRHNRFHLSQKTPEILAQNAAEFHHYFHSESHGKRLWLNGEEILKLEKSLSLTLSRLISFHKSILVEKDKITTDFVFEIEELLRDNIEKLMCIGIATDIEQTPAKKIVVVNKLLEQGFRPIKVSFEDGTPPLKETIEKYSVQVYGWEQERLKRFEYTKSGVDYYMKEIENFLNEQKKITPTKASAIDDMVLKMKIHLDHMVMRYKEVNLVNRLKEIQLKYYKEYISVVTTEHLTLESLVKKKAGNIDNFFRDVNIRVKELVEAFNKFIEKEAEGNGNGKMRQIFIGSFRRITDELLDNISKVFTAGPNTFYQQIRRLDLEFKEPFKKLQENLMFYSQKLDNITLA